MYCVWYLPESNRGHKDFQSFALPTELRYHNYRIVISLFCLPFVSTKIQLIINEKNLFMVFNIIIVFIFLIFYYFLVLFIIV